MPLNSKEKLFIASINEKIKRYSINTTLKETFSKKSGYLVETIYNNNEVEVVDSGVELYLIKKSFNYFLNKYCRVDIPGIGSIPMEPYYFQIEMAKEVLNYRKIIVDKSRQVGISTIFSLYALWRIQFFASESIDVVSLKQLKAQQFVKKMRSTLNNLPKWMQLERSADNQQKLGFVHPNGAVSEILSESQSDNAGRSDSLSLLILDEAAHYQSEKMIRSIVASAQPTLNKTGGTMIVVSCLTEDTYIFTNNGMQQIKDFKPKNCKLGFNDIPEFKIDGINHQQQCNTFYDSGITPTKKIFLQNKNMNEISEVHPYYIIDETSPFPYFKQARDIKVGEYALASCREKTFGNNDSFNFNYIPRRTIGRLADKNIKNFNNIITEDMAYFFGMLIGDGYIHWNPKNMYCIITANDIETQKWLLENPHFECYRENRRKDNIHFRLQGKYLIEMLKQLGFTKQKSKTKTFPKRLLQMSRKNTAALLRGLFDADGHSRSRDGSIGYTSTSKELLKQVKLLLDMFGIQISDERWNTISPEKSTRVNVKSYVGQITLSRYFSKLFYEKIGFNIKRKQEKYESVKNIKYSTSQSYPDIKFWIRDNLINKYIDDKLQQKLAKGIRKGYTSPARILRYENNNKTTRYHIRMILDYYDGVLNETEEYKRLLDFYEKDWYLLKIKNIENGKAHTYDFTIPETSSFYANGAITRNTPNGTSGKGAWYYEQIEAAKNEISEDTKYLEIDWWEVPDDKRIKGPKKGYNEILEKAIKENYYYNRKIKQKYKEFFDPIAKEHWKDNSWLKASMDDLQELTYKQEILHEFVISGSKVFSENVIDKMKEKIKPPRYKDYINKTEVKGFWVWKKPTPKHRYIIGVDISSGTSNDYSSIQVFDTIEYEQVAEYKGFISTPNLSRLINKIAKAYNNAYVVIECNSIGDGVFNALYYNENDPYRNVFKQKKTKNGVTRMTGWITDIKTRKLIVNEFIDWITVDELWDSINIYSSRLHEEVKTWVWKAGNKAEHADGCVSGDTIITCKDGFKQIKDIKAGDCVLTHLGNFKKVEKTFKFKDDKKIMREIEAYGFPKLKISADQEMLTYENNNFIFKDGFSLKEGDDIYSMFNKRSNNISKISGPNQTAIGAKIAGVRSEIKIPEIEQIYNDLKKGFISFDLMFAKKENYKHILLSIINNDGIHKGNKNITFKNKNIYINYFIAHMLYKNNIAFSFANNIIKLTYTNYNDLTKLLNIEQVETDKFRSSRVWKKKRLNSTIKSITEIDWNDYYYDLTVEDDHSYIANGYVVHNCHDDSIIAMSLCLYNRSKAQVSEKIFAISDKGETVEFNSEEVEEEDTSFASKSFAFVEDDEEENPFGNEQEIYEWLVR